MGKGLASYAAEVRSAGNSARVFTSSDSFLLAKQTPDLTIIEESHGGSVREIKALLKCTPKIIITGNSANHKTVSWLKEPRAYMLNMPSAAELASFASRILSESSEINEASTLNRKLATLRAELNLFEDIHHLMYVSSYIDDFLPAIMKHATGITGAEAWAVHLVDPETTELRCAKTSGRLSKECSSTVAALASWSTARKKQVLVEDISNDKRFSPRASKSCKNRSVSVMSAFIEGKSGVLGSLELLKSRKPFKKDDMDFLIKFADRTALVIERISLQQKLEELVITDDLTNLFNTRYLTRSIETEIYRSRRYGHSVSVIFMDVDHFKNVNDVHGHLVGSKVLVEMAEILIRELRNIDIVARYGGDEFVIVLPQTDLGNALAIAERIRQSIEKNTFLESEGLDLHLTASFGVAAYPESAKSKDALMRIADESMYNVKRHTRNGVYAIIQ